MQTSCRRSLSSRSKELVGLDDEIRFQSKAIVRGTKGTATRPWREGHCAAPLHL